MDWEALLPLIVAIIMLVMKTIQGGKYKKYLDAAIELNRTVYSAVEEAKASSVKDLVKEALVNKEGKIVEINKMLMPVIDSEKAGDAPPIKRFWRRLLAGQNLAGVAVRVAANSAIKKHLNDR